VCQGSGPENAGRLETKDNVPMVAVLIQMCSASTEQMDPAKNAAGKKKRHGKRKRQPGLVEGGRQTDSFLLFRSQVSLRRRSCSDRLGWGGKASRVITRPFLLGRATYTCRVIRKDPGSCVTIINET